MITGASPLNLSFRVRCRDRVLTLQGGTQIMGILNLTPDSFFDGGRYAELPAALSQGRLSVVEGASVLDIGGQSTRPGYVEISEAEEIARVVPILQALVPAVAVPLSVDTYKPAVAEAALRAGAHILNDIYGLQRHPEMAALAAKHGAAVVAMHHEPAFATSADDVIARVKTFFRRTLDVADQAGLSRQHVILDPGIGFGKTQEQNLELIARLSELHELGCPLLLGASRKSVIAHVLDVPVDERLEGTLATTAEAAAQGVQLVRVHDVKANARLLRMLDAIRQKRTKG